MPAGSRLDRIRQKAKVLACLLLVAMVLYPVAVMAQDGETPPLESDPPPLTEVPQPPTETPPPPTMSPPPPSPTAMLSPPTLVPASTDVPQLVQTPGTVGSPTGTLAPTLLPAPSVTCVQEGAVGAVSANQVVQFRCDYAQGPITPVIVTLAGGWQFSIAGADVLQRLTWHDGLDIDFPTFAEPAGIVRIFLRAGETAVPGPETVRMSFRAADYSVAAPASVVHLQVTVAAPTSTPEPSIAFAPDVECAPSQIVGTGEGAWAVRDCAATWQTENMVSIDLAASTSDSAWQVVVVDSSDAESAAALEANDNVLNLTDSDPNDSGFYSARFSVGTKVTACSTADTADISLAFSSVSHAPVPKDAAGNPLVDITTSPIVAETYNATTTGDRAAPTDFSVSLIDASFSPIDLSSGASTSTAIFVISYTAPVGCEWQVSLEVVDLINGSESISAADLVFTSISGIDASLGPSGPGAVTITPGASVTATSGQVVVTGTLTLEGDVSFGQYRTTATATGILLP